MNICIINNFYHPDHCGGAELSVQVLAETLIVMGHQVFVITTGSQDVEEMFNGVRIYRISIRNLYDLNYIGWANKYFNFLWHAMDTFNFPTVQKAINIIRRECPDIIHTNNLKGFSAGVWPFIKQLGIPVVHTLRDYYLICPKGTMYNDGEICVKPCLTCGVYNYGRRVLSKYVDTVVGNSNFILQIHLENSFFPNAKTRIVHNAYDRSLKDLTLEPINDGFVAGYIGRLGPYKGIELLLEAFSSIKEENAILFLAGVGDSTYETTLRKKYSSNAIRFKGFLRPEDFFPFIDVLVVPSLWHDPLPRVIFEGYAYGVPVIASRRGGIPEIVEDGITGLLFDPSDSASLANAIRRLMAPGIRKPMRSAAFHKFSEFKPDKIVTNYLDIYRGLTS
jgi:glycosyltransferase involved in cell wall biosynthesis